jgi:hypothetical protein
MKHLEHLPQGFVDLAREGLLSVQVIDRLGLNRAEIVTLASTSPMDREQFRPLKAKMPPLERMIWAAFSVFHLCTSTYKADREDLATAFIQCSQKMGNESEAANDCLLWAGCLVVTVQTIESEELPYRREAKEILLTRFKMSVDEMSAVAQRFLWNEAMSAGLKAVI